jgi:hypothetical protein
VEKIAFDTALPSPGADKIHDKNRPHRNFIGNKFTETDFLVCFYWLFLLVINR